MNLELKRRNADRLKKSIAGEKVDAHPVFFFYTYPFFQASTGVDLDKFFHDPETCMNAQLEAFEKLDGMGNLIPDMGSVCESSGLGGHIHFDDHGFISVSENEMVVDFDDADDVRENLKPGDPWGDNYMTRALETLEYMVKHCPDGYRVNPHIMMGPYTVGAQLRGISDFCADTLDEPELVKAIMDVVVETQIRFFKEQEKILGGLHHIFVCDDLSAFLSAEDYAEFVAPYYNKFFKEFPNTQRWLHNDSTSSHLAQVIADEAKMVAWQYHPSLTPEKAFADTRNQVSMLGGFNPVEMQGWSVEETIQKTNELIDSFQGNPRGVISAGGSVNQVPVENLMAIFKVADERKI